MGNEGRGFVRRIQKFVKRQCSVVSFGGSGGNLPVAM